MFENVIALDSKIHANYRLAHSQDFGFARHVLSAPLSMTEIIKASREFPIFFPTSGRFLPIAQMGYQKGKNLYIDENGKWTARYTPAHIRRYPFILGEKQIAGEYVLMVDKKRIAPHGDGPNLFEDGKVPINGIVDRARQLLTDFQKELEQTELFLQPLKDSGILVSRIYTIRQGDTVLGTIKDLQVVDPKRMSELQDKTLSDWVRSGLMELIMAHLHSLGNWDNSHVISKN